MEGPRTTVPSGHKTDAHRNSQTLQEHTQVLHGLKPDTIPALRESSRLGLLPLTIVLSTIGTHLQGKSESSPMASHRVYQPHFKIVPGPEDGQCKIDSVVLM